MDRRGGSQLHLTGGIGGVEARLGAAYELLMNRLPRNLRGIANVFWNHRLFLLRAGGIRGCPERVLYNGFLSGVALSDDRFPVIRSKPTGARNSIKAETNARVVWVLLLSGECGAVHPSIAGYIYATRGETLREPVHRRARPPG